MNRRALAQRPSVLVAEKKGEAANKVAASARGVPKVSKAKAKSSARTLMSAVSEAPPCELDGAEQPAPEGVVGSEVVDDD